VWPVVWVIWRWHARRSKSEDAKAGLGEAGNIASDSEKTRDGDPGYIAGRLLVILLLGIYVTNLGYLFDGSFQQLKDYQFVSQTLGGPTASHAAPNNRFRDTLLGAIPVPFPVDYIHGIDLQKLDFEGERWSYAGGVQQKRGWWWWYLYAMAVKVPHGTMLIVLMAGMAGRSLASETRATMSDWLALIPALCILVLVSSQTGFSRYIRYLLPAFPFVFVWAS